MRPGQGEVSMSCQNGSEVNTVIQEEELVFADDPMSSPTVGAQGRKLQTGPWGSSEH